MADFDPFETPMKPDIVNQNLMSGMPVSDLVKYRDELVKNYHGGTVGLAEKLRNDKSADMDTYLFAFIEELIKETDHLLGNEMIAANSGDLRDSSVISMKRAEILEKAIKAVQTRQQIESQSGIDVESPSMLIIFRYFLSKVKETFDKMAVGNEINDLFFATFGDVTENWQKELKKQFDSLKDSSKNNPIRNK